MDAYPHLSQKNVVGTMIGPCQLFYGVHPESGPSSLLAQVWTALRNPVESGVIQEVLNWIGSSL